MAQDNILKLGIPKGSLEAQTLELMRKSGWRISVGERSYIPRADAEDEVGALLMAVATADGRFELAGKVGTGFDKETRKKLARLLDAEGSSTATVIGKPRLKGARWSRITHVAEIALAEWTKDGSARAPTFLALREDKSPLECRREVEVRDETAAPRRSVRKPRAVHDVARGAGPMTAGATEVKVTNPTKVIFPRDGITKADVVGYYESVADLMLPHLAGRPIGVQRWPNGIDEAAWFQQNAPENVPAFVRVVNPGTPHEGKRKIFVENPQTLAWLGNLAALTIHQWASHAPETARTGAAITRALGEADYTVIDLDPGDGPWEHLIEVANALRGLLDELQLESVVKTSGQRGLHIVIPFMRGPSHGDATEFGRKLATSLANALPEIATVERMKAKRRGRLYIDFLQNGEGKTIVAPYTIRARDGAPVSAPIRWAEVTRKLDPGRFTIRTVLDRAAKYGDLFANALQPKQRLPRVQ